MLFQFFPIAAGFAAAAPADCWRPWSKSIDLCVILVFSAFGRKVHTLLMDEATEQLNLRIRVDGLRDDLVFLCGDLKKNGYDFTMALEPRLRETEPVSHELVQRLTARLQSLQEKVSRVKLTNERAGKAI
jgi:hypothetical protein